MYSVELQPPGIIQLRSGWTRSKQTHTQMQPRDHHDPGPAMSATTTHNLLDLLTGNERLWLAPCLEYRPAFVLLDKGEGREMCRMQRMRILARPPRWGEALSLPANK